MLIYRAAFANQITVDLDDGLGAEPMVNEREAVRTAMKLVAEWTQKAGCSRPILTLSSVKSDSFRHRLWPDYKANRTGSKPLAYATIRSALEMEFEVYQEAGLEADDLMGIGGSAENAQCVIVSGDKDMKTVPAIVFNPMQDKRPVRIKPAIADQMWMRQTMIGDSVDNYPGIPGVGPTTADAILLSPHRLRKTNVGKRVAKWKWVKGEPCSLWQSMLDYAEKAEVDEAHLITMAQVARILRTGDFNKETRTVRLWHPAGNKELVL